MISRIKAEDAKSGMRWLDKPKGCKLITSVKPSQLEECIEIVCEEIKAGEGGRVSVIDLHYLERDQVISVEIDEFTKENYIPSPGCDNPFEGGSSSPEELDKILEWWEGSMSSKEVKGSFAMTRFAKNEDGR